MNKRLAILLNFLTFILLACNYPNCDQLPKTFSSYEEAIKTIKKGHFKIQESVNTSNSTWIRSASFFSCDGNSGYFIFGTDQREYIHADLPINVWKDFKSASSFGRYYNNNIKHKYSINEYIH